MLVPGSHRIIPQLQARFTQKFRREREDEEDPWMQRSGQPVTKGDDFTIDNDEALDELLGEHGLRRETHRASAGDVLFFSSYLLHSSHRNEAGSRDRWALIASYRDASVDDTCRVFPRPRAVLRRKCKALGQQTADANRTSAEELAARYIMPAKMQALNAALVASEHENEPGPAISQP